MTTVASRASPPFGRTVSTTVPLPEPLEPLAIVIHDAVGVAVHPHAGELAPTATLIDPPDAGLDASGGVTVYRHGAGSCVTSTVVSLTVTTPCRGDGSMFAATRYVKVASPCPFVEDAIEIHGVGVDADQVQSRLVAMVSVPDAPAAGTEEIELVTETEHFSPDGDVTEMDDEPQADARQASAIDQSRPAVTDERCCRALMRAAHECKHFAQLGMLIRSGEGARILAKVQWGDSWPHVMAYVRLVACVTAAPIVPLGTHAVFRRNGSGRASARRN